MTTTAAPPQQQPTAAQNTALAVTLASALMTAATAATLLAIARRAFRLAGVVVSDVALATVIQVIMSFPPPRIEGTGPAGAWAQRANVSRRVAFFINSARRADAELRAGRAAGQPLARTVARLIASERRYFAQHVQADQGRTAAAARVDSARLNYGGVLGWRAVHDSRTSAECKDADGHNFLAGAPPDIGYPGTVHPHCRCYPVRAFPGASLLPTAGIRMVRPRADSRRFPRAA